MWLLQIKWRRSQGSIFFFLFVICLIGRVGGQAPAIKKPFGNGSLSANGQIVVYGKDVRLRQGVLGLIEELRKELQMVAGFAEMKNTIVLELLDGATTEGSEKVFFKQEIMSLPKGYRIQLLVRVQRGLKKEELEERLLEICLLERALQKEGAQEENKQVILPRWILVGLRERLQWRRGLVERGLYRSLFERQKVFSVEDILEENMPGVEALEQTAFRVSAGAFTMALLSRPEGKEAFGNFLEKVVSFEGDVLILLREHYPELGLSPNSLAKWWALQLANLTQDFVTETLSILQTEEELANILGTGIGERGIKLEFKAGGIKAILKLKEEERRSFSQRILSQLALLNYRAFPDSRVLIRDYGELAKKLYVGGELSEAEFQGRLAVLEQRRRDRVKVGKRVRDYLDWYQITQATELSGEFEDYFELKRNLNKETRLSTGPLAEYLDGVQALFD